MLNFPNVSLLSVHDRDVYSEIKEIKNTCRDRLHRIYKIEDITDRRYNTYKLDI